MSGIRDEAQRSETQYDEVMKKSFAMATLTMFILSGTVTSIISSMVHDRKRAKKITGNID